MNNVIDSVGWIAYLKNDALGQQYMRYMFEPKHIITPTIVIYEVTKQIKLQLSEKESSYVLEQMKKTNIIDLNSDLAVYASQLSIIHKLPMADSIIYATALSNNAQLITSDSHFIELPNVVFIPHIA